MTHVDQLHHAFHVFTALKAFAMDWCATLLKKWSAK